MTRTERSRVACFLLLIALLMATAFLAGQTEAPNPDVTQVQLPTLSTGVNK